MDLAGSRHGAPHHTIKAGWGGGGGCIQRPHLTINPRKILCKIEGKRHLSEKSKWNNLIEVIASTVSASAVHFRSQTFDAIVTFPGSVFTTGHVPADVGKSIRTPPGMLPSSQASNSLTCQSTTSGGGVAVQTAQLAHHKRRCA